MMATKKSFIVKIYASDGSTLRKVLTNERPSDTSLPYLKNVPQFRSRINGGFGECVLDLAYPFDDFSEGTVVDFMNIVKIYAVVNNAGTQTSTLIYTGFISKYTPYIESGSEGVRVVCLGLVSLLSFSYYKNGTSFTVTHSSDDPETIGRAIIDHVNSIYTASLLSYTDDTTDPVGTAVSITFNDQKWFDALKKTGELAGAGWWWKIDESGTYWLKAKPSAATHTFTIGKNVVRLTAPKDSEKIVNDIQVRGDGVTTDDFDSTSQTDYGVRTKIITDSQLKDTNATSQRANKEIEDHKDPTIAAPVEIDSSYDIESIKVGETCRIRNFRKANTFFSSNMQIIGVHYLGDTVRLELDEHPADFGLELERFVSA